MQVLVPAGQTVFVLTLHELCTQGDMGLVAGWQVPQIAVGERAQNVLAHCASSPHAAPWARVPAAGVHIAPKSPSRNWSQPRAGSVCPQLLVLAAEALVPRTL